MIRIKQFASCFCISFLAAFSVMAESKPTAGDTEREILWDNGYWLHADYRSTWKSIDDKEKNLINVLDKYYFKEKSYQFGSALEYAVQAGSVDVFEAFLRHGLTRSEVKEALGKTVSSYMYDRMHQRSPEIIKRYEKIIELILNLKEYEKNSTEINDLFVHLIDKASAELMQVFKKYQFPQGVINDAMLELISEMVYDFSSTVVDDVVGKIDILMTADTPPSRAKIVDAVKTAKEKEKYHAVIPVLFKRFDQDLFDRLQDMLMDTLRTDLDARRIFHRKGLVIKPTKKDESPFVQAWKGGRDAQWEDYFIFVASHYQGDGRFNDKLIIREALATGSERIIQAIASVKGAETIFTDVLPQQLDSLGISKSNGDKVSYTADKLTVQTIINSPAEVNLARLLEKVLSLGDPEIMDATIARLGVKALSSHQALLLKYIDDKQVRGALLDHGFVFATDNAVLESVLDRFEKKASSDHKAQLAFVVRNYKFTGGDTDRKAIVRLQKLAPELVREALTGELGEPMQQVAFLLFVDSLSQFKPSYSSMMLDKPEDLARIPVPEEGFEAFICKLVGVKEYPENPVQTFSLIQQWLHAAGHDLDTVQLQTCAFGSRGQISKMPLAQFSFVFSLLYRYQWAVDPTVASHIKARVLNHVEDIMALLEKEAEGSPYDELFPLTRWLSEQVDGGVEVPERYISGGTGLRWITFKKWSGSRAMALFVDNVLSFYPEETYQKYLKYIYRSENIKLLSYVLSNPGHLVQFQKHVDVLLKNYRRDFEESELPSKASLLLMHCVVPQDIENPTVVAVGQQCVATSDHTIEDVSILETCRLCNVDDGSCDFVLAAPLDDSIKSILKRKFSAKPVLPEQVAAKQ